MTLLSTYVAGSSTDCSRSHQVRISIVEIVSKVGTPFQVLLPGKLVLVTSKDEQNSDPLHQHPYLRLFVCYVVILCNLLMFAEDPVSHSKRGVDDNLELTIMGLQIKPR